MTRLRRLGEALRSPFWAVTALAAVVYGAVFGWGMFLPLIVYYCCAGVAACILLANEAEADDTGRGW